MSTSRQRARRRDKRAEAATRMRCRLLMMWGHAGFPTMRSHCAFGIQWYCAKYGRLVSTKRRFISALKSTSAQAQVVPAGSSTALYSAGTDILKSLGGAVGSGMIRLIKTRSYRSVLGAWIPGISGKFASFFNTIASDIFPLRCLKGLPQSVNGFVLLRSIHALNHRSAE